MRIETHSQMVLAVKIYHLFLKKLMRSMGLLSSNKILNNRGQLILIRVKLLQISSNSKLTCIITKNHNWITENQVQ